MLQSLHSLDSPSLFKKGRGEVNLIAFPRGGESEKSNKRGWKYGTGAGLLKKGGGLALFLFNFFKVITLPFAKLSYAFEQKLFFSATIILRKKVILNCVKPNLKISHK